MIANIITILACFAVAYLFHTVWPEGSSSCLIALTTGIGASVAMIAAIIAILDLIESIRTRQMEIAVKIFNLLHSIEVREEREHIFKKMPSNPEEMSGENWETAWNVLAKLFRVGIVMYHGVVNERMILHNHHYMIILLWHRVKPHVMYERKEFSIFQTYPEWLAFKSEQWHIKKGTARPIEPIMVVETI